MKLRPSLSGDIRLSDFVTRTTSRRKDHESFDLTSPVVEMNISALEPHHDLPLLNSLEKEGVVKYISMYSQTKVNGDIARCVRMAQCLGRE